MIVGALDPTGAPARLQEVAAGMGSYRFLTTWRIEAPREQIWAVLRDPAGYPQWWRGVARLEVREPGSTDGTGQRVAMTVRSRLPYGLSFETVAREVRKPDLIVLDSTGELEGTGRWELHEHGGVTTVTYLWEVVTTSAWMKVIEPFARPAFVWNHHVVMGWAGQGLARHLDARLLAHEAEPPVRPVDWAALGGVGLLAVAVIARRRQRG